MRLIKFLKNPLIAGMKEVGLPIVPLDDIDKVLEELGFKREDEEEPFNGWKVDFWYHYDHTEYGRWCLTGSLWYGNYKFCKDEEDTTEEREDGTKED